MPFADASYMADAYVYPISIPSVCPHLLCNLAGEYKFGEMLVVFLGSPNSDVTFKITVKFKIIIIDFQFIVDFKSHIDHS